MFNAIMRDPNSMDPEKFAIDKLMKFICELFV